MTPQTPAPSARTEPTVTKISSPAEVARLVPHLLGFAPHDSVVVVSFAGPRRRLGPVARFDQPTEAEHIDLVLAGLEPLLLNAGVEEVMAIAFVDTAPEDIVDETLDALGFFVAGHGFDLVAAVVVRDEQWRYSGEPWRGEVLPDPVQVPAVMAYVEIGSAPLPSREALGDALVPLPEGPAAEELRRLVAGCLDRRSRPLAWLMGVNAPTSSWAEVESGWHEDAMRWATVLGLDAQPHADRPGLLDPLPELAPGELAALVASLEDRAFRDALIAWVVPDATPAPDLGYSLHDVDAVVRPVLGPVPDPEDGQVQATLGRLEELVRRLPLDLQAPLLTMLGVARWAEGAGAAADLAVTQALAGRPGYRLAELVEALITHQVPPRGRGRQDRPREATV